MNRLSAAIEVAAQAHAGQVRKGTSTPYVSHPCAVGMMLARAGCAEDLVIAGILPDTVEDTDLTLAYIREHFGDHVARIVEGCSEPDKSLPWEERKSHTLQYLRTAPWEVRVVSCADKLHNIQTVSENYQQIGDRVWERFKRGRKEQEWYYRGLVEVLCSQREGEETIPFCGELREEVERVFGEA
ncbi:MAG: HD domain-containing protein [Chloroflexota bacterium]|nr:HD domain-containing protein [Chloroflexota bacterium]